tara:strand:+ start:2151 stop:3563 length:1413 start_codon:yes stop_codon:yes gene_type:complete
MLFSEIKNYFKDAKIFGNLPNKKITYITNDSRNTDKNSLYIIDKKYKFHKLYLNEALENKVSTIITNKYFKDININQIVVRDIEIKIINLIRKKLPYDPKKTVAITGTNGKTSTTWYLAQICKLCNYSAKLVGTLGYYENLKKIKDTNLTTPNNLDLLQFSKSIVRKSNFFICEASSHGLAQGRLNNLQVDVAAITNISHDHLDYHKNFNNYVKSKFSLFTKFLDKNGIAVINYRLNNFQTLKKRMKQAKIRTIIFGYKDVYFKYKKKLYLNIFRKKFLINNLELNNTQKENLECAIACAISMDIDIKEILKIIPKLTNAPGRFECIKYKKKLSKIIIDYAHTPDALEHILKTYTYKKIKPSLIFGCGGDRDKLKRKKMAQISAKYADKVYITDDNPRYENPSKIRKELKKYCQKGIEISSRRKAIKVAIENLIKNEVLIIAGKGHEKYQIIKNKKYKFDDFKIAKSYLL